MIDVRAGGYSLRDVLTAPPKISDHTDGVCRTLSLQIKNSKELKNLMGAIVEMYDGEERLFYGRIRKKGLDVNGAASLTAYDPLYHFKHNTDDFYFKKGTVTATKVFQDLAARTGVKVGKLANTKVVMPALYYQGGEPNKIAVDVLARTKAAGGKNFWYRYDPSVKNLGLQLFERVVPSEIWAFQVGVNLTAATYEESAEELITQVKLVNRDTGKVVIKKNDAMLERYGKTQHFEEVDKDQAATMDRKASALLKDLSRIVTTSKVDGFNNGDMPMFYSGDVIYVEERNTGLIGAYHIINVEQEYVSSKLVNIAMDIEKTASIAAVQYEDATTDPSAEAKKAKADEKKAAAKKKRQEAAAKRKADKESAKKK